jgi:uncharacterized membrane protein YfcA
VIAIPFGLVIGLSLGALGGGGSILTVPILVYAVGLEPRAATTSSLVIVGTTALLALLAHARARRVRFAQGVLFGALGTAGSFAGSALSAQVPAAALLAGFGALLLVVALLMLRRAAGRAHEVRRDHEPTLPPMLTLRPMRCVCSRVVTVVLTASGVGLLTGFFGVGGGFVLVPALVLALGYTMPVAVGTSLLVIAINSATALAARVGSAPGEVDWPLVTVFTAAAVAGSLVGSRLASRVDPRHLTRAFGLLLVAVAAYTVARSLPALA